MLKRKYILSVLFFAVLISLFFLDQSIRILISKIMVDHIMNIMGLISDIGGWGYLSVIALALWGFGCTRKYKRLKTAGWYGILSVLGSRFIVEILKHLSGRPRPAIFDSEGFRIGPTFAGGYDSFPSGHAASSFAFAYILSKFYPERRYLFYTGAIIISLSRIYLDTHFTSDVYAGGVVGLISGMVIYNYIERKRSTI